MRTIRIKLYKFNELSEDAKQKAIKNYRQNNWEDGCLAFDTIIEDAQQINLEIESLDDHRPNKGQFYDSAEDTAKLILNTHGENCETYKDAKNFLDEYLPAKEKFEKENEGFYFEDEDASEEMAADFLNNLLEDYRIMLNKEIEYQNSDEQITETIEANEYEFKENGEFA